MRASERCVDAIKSFEGLKLEAYKCPANVWTIGFGHIRGVREGQVITVFQADYLLKEDLSFIETYLNNLSILKTQGQFDAICDFCFNLGIPRFANSTLYKAICQGQSDEVIGAQFMRWIYCNGRPLNGLINRRKWEVQQWQIR